MIGDRIAATTRKRDKVVIVKSEGAGTRQKGGSDLVLWKRRYMNVQTTTMTVLLTHGSVPNP